jgi:hypothetical protein
VPNIRASQKGAEASAGLYSFAVGTIPLPALIRSSFKQSLAQNFSTDLRDDSAVRRRNILLAAEKFLEVDHLFSAAFLSDAGKLRRSARSVGG